MPADENNHSIRRNAVERLQVHVTFDEQRGYVASSDVLGTITALSLSGLRRQIDARLGKDVIPRLVLDKRARVERDARRAGGGAVRATSRRGE